MNETSKSKILMKRRGDFEKYLKGKGIDVGGGDDVLKVPNGTVDRFDLDEGDGLILQYIPDGSYDFLYSSHTLEHLFDIEFALANWIRVVRNGGFLYITVPDYKIYEKLQFPSRFNEGHLHTFSIDIIREETKRKNHYNIEKDLKPILEKYGAEVIRIEFEDYNYDYTKPEFDQTLGTALCQISIVCKKTSKRDITVNFGNLTLEEQVKKINLIRYIYNHGFNVKVKNKSFIFDNLRIFSDEHINMISFDKFKEIYKKEINLESFVFPGILSTKEEYNYIRLKNEEVFDDKNSLYVRNRKNLIKLGKNKINICRNIFNSFCSLSILNKTILFNTKEKINYPDFLFRNIKDETQVEQKVNELKNTNFFL